jgi:tRNA splicing endonuclease
MFDSYNDLIARNRAAVLAEWGRCLAVGDQPTALKIATRTGLARSAVYRHLKRLGFVAKKGFVLRGLDGRDHAEVQVRIALVRAAKIRHGATESDGLSADVLDEILPD